MEVTLLSVAGIMILFVVQFMEFVHREHATQLASRISAIVINVAAVVVIHVAAIRYVFLPIGTG
jgi:hypothetical protein